MREYQWSQWHNFDEPTVDASPEAPGVFMMHAAMKILHIGGSDNIRRDLKGALNKVCVSDATRFKYAEDADYHTAQEELIADYKERHSGDLPKCMK